MTDAEIAYNCVFHKTYQNKVEFLIEIKKITDRKILIGLLMDLSIRDKEFESDKNQMMQICAELMTKSELEDTEFLTNSVSYYQNLIAEINNKELVKNTFLADFYSKLMEKVNDDGKYEVSEEDIKDLLLNNKEHLTHLKEKLINSELYEVIPIVDKYMNI